MTHAVRDTIDEQCIRKFGRQTAIQAITDLRTHETNRKVSCTSFHLLIRRRTIKICGLQGTTVAQEATMAAR